MVDDGCTTVLEELQRYLDTGFCLGSTDIALNGYVLSAQTGEQGSDLGKVMQTLEQDIKRIDAQHEVLLTTHA